MHHPTDKITYATAFVTPVVEHVMEPKIAQWVSIDLLFMKYDKFVLLDDLPRIGDCGLMVVNQVFLLCAGVTLMECNHHNYNQKKYENKNKHYNDCYRLLSDSKPSVSFPSCTISSNRCKFHNC